MRTIILVARYEINLIAGGKAFWIFTLALPLLLLFVNVAIQNSFTQSIGNEYIAPILEPDVRIISYIDSGNLIETLPDNFLPDRLQLYLNEDEAMKALQAEEIAQFYVIDPHYLENGRITIFTEQSLPITGMIDARELEDLLTHNLLGDKNTAVLFADPIPSENLTTHRLETAVPQTENFGFLMLIFTFFFMFLFSGGQYMLRSISRETKNRTLELLLISTNSRHFMWGKLIGLSGIALFQILLWGGLFSLIPRPTNQLAALPEEYTAVTVSTSTTQFPPGFLLWAAIFLFFGFFMMTALFLVIGVVSPKTRFAVQISSIILFIMLFVFGLNFAVIVNPESPSAILLSLFPFSAPISMTTRLAVSSPPSWQVGLSLLGIILTINLFVWLATRLVRADRLLVGLSRPAFLKWNRAT